MSGMENHESSLESFQSASREFAQTRIKIETEASRATPDEDKRELETWLEITRGREKYSQGRIELEEAIILDRKGEEEASARKYGSASAVFGDLMTDAGSEPSRREFETLTYLSDAWRKMKEAEINASSELYSSAANSFNRVQGVATTRKFRLLSLANASMCHALEAGTTFRQTREPDLYARIKKSLETASDYYGEAGLENAANWTRATQRLFDALVYLSNAETEIDSKKKPEFYQLAEKHLQQAARLFEKAGYTSKKEEALRHLQRAREEKELLLTPEQALADSPAIRAVAVAPVSLLRDQSVGLEKFDVAHVVGNMSSLQKECSVGTDVTLEMELANIGKTAATLIKLENIAPIGLEINKEGSTNRLEDNFLDLKGRRLDYMKSHEVRVSLKAKRKGTFEIRPRILFVDESGSYKSYEFEPATLIVRELGIGGWLKGPE